MERLVLLMWGVVIPARFERATPRLGIWCSILLSYGTAWEAV